MLYKTVPKPRHALMLLLLMAVVLLVASCAGPATQPSYDPDDHRTLSSNAVSSIDKDQEGREIPLDSVIRLHLHR